jgi:hypothetical protein
MCPVVGIRGEAGGGGSRAGFQHRKNRRKSMRCQLKTGPAFRGESLSREQVQRRDLRISVSRALHSQWLPDRVICLGKRISIAIYVRMIKRMVEAPALAILFGGLGSPVQIRAFRAVVEIASHSPHLVKGRSMTRSHFAQLPRTLLVAARTARSPYPPTRTGRAHHRVVHGTRTHSPQHMISYLLISFRRLNHAASPPRASCLHTD